MPELSSLDVSRVAEWFGRLDEPDRLRLLGALAAAGGESPVGEPAGARPLRVPADVSVRALEPGDWPAVRRIYAEGIATGQATFETEVPSRRDLEAKWSPAHRWVAEVDGEVVGWTAISPMSTRDCYAGVGESSVYVGAAARGRGVGKALLHQQVRADRWWSLQTAIFPENRASLALHRAAGYRTIGVRERVAQLHGVWRDTVLLERRRPDG